MSAVDPSLKAPIRPSFPPSAGQPGGAESAGSASIISALTMEAHPEGGYFAETDRDKRRVANPFDRSYDSGMTSTTTASGAPMHIFSESTTATEAASNPAARRWTGLTRAASTSIFYLLTARRSAGRFHRNKGRTVHTLHKGRGMYVIIHADEVAMGLRREARVEAFVVGQDVAKGERLQWIVEGEKYKASFLLPDEEGVEGSRDGLLISETVVPGFEFADHDFLTSERLKELVTPEQADELAWLLRTDE